MLSLYMNTFNVISFVYFCLCFLWLGDWGAEGAQLWKPEVNIKCLLQSLQPVSLSRIWTLVIRLAWLASLLSLLPCAGIACMNHHTKLRMSSGNQVQVFELSLLAEPYPQLSFWILTTTTIKKKILNFFL